MVGRVWRGWTKPENADIYENLLKTEIFPGIASKNVAGFREIQLFRSELEDRVEFMTIMWFDSLDAVKRFVGDDYEKAYVPDKAREVLMQGNYSTIYYYLKRPKPTQFLNSKSASMTSLAVAMVLPTDRSMKSKCSTWSREASIPRRLVTHSSPHSSIQLSSKWAAILCTIGWPSICKTS